ncbi:uncharacterized protein LOC113658114 [Tachysurus fulvidraco]|uniref:uncharacterized protein LOC113658114 n=1 Tax=Tachysurus fulvidraco TaxID=1234273 RepID=UPI001FEEE809|nr:uncharacterized protein LOC113658114 [Tachysurus fulvidraco]
MMAWCRFESYHLIFLLMVATAERKKCDVLPIVEAVVNSVATLTCPLTTLPEGTQVIWEVLQGERAERVGFVSTCSSSCSIEDSNNRTQQPLCKMREVKDLQKGTSSLIISPVGITDAVWYQCTVQNRTDSYCSHVKIAVKEEPQLQTHIKECITMDPVERFLNETFILQCPVDRSHLGSSQLIWGTVEADVTIPITRCPTSCTFRGAQKPLCERTKTMEDGSLTISHMSSTDSQWFWCALSTSCYKFRLTVKENTSTNRITIYSTIKAGGDLHATQGPQEQTNDSSVTVVTTNATVIMIASVTAVTLFVAMLVLVYIFFRKKKMKNTHKVVQDNLYDVSEETIHNDLLPYTLVQFETPILYTFNVK